MLSKFRNACYVTCCVMTALIAVAWLLSYFVYCQFFSSTEHHLVFVKSGDAVFSYHAINVENPGAPADSAYTTIFGRGAHEKLHRDLIYSISKLRELTPRRYVVSLSPPTGWWSIDPIRAVKRITETGRVRNAMGTRTDVVLPYSVVFWVFATWPLVRWWRRRRNRSGA